jgi:hypothetical protein
MEGTQMASPYVEPITHAVVTLGLLAGYVTLQITGHTDTALLGVLGGYMGALGTTQVAQQVKTANGGNG